MSITKRVLIYSIGVISFIMVLLIGYFYFMLSPLYVDYVENDRLRTIREVHTEFLRDENYSQGEKIHPSDLTYSTIKVPIHDYTITLYANGGSIEFHIVDKDLREILDTIRNIDYLSEENNENFHETLEPYFEDVLDVLKEKFSFSSEELNKYIMITKNTFVDDEDSDAGHFKFIGEKFHYISNDQGIYETQVATATSYYTSYIGMLKTDSNFFITFGTGITPKLTGLRPVVVESLPTIIVVSICLILAATLVFSRMLILPMKHLSKIAREMEQENYQPKEVVEKRNDEFSQLEAQLNRGYIKQQSSMELLKESNQQLQDKNKQQKVFLMASSHQLKTPVASGLLLVDSMMNKVGKFSDHEKYLPHLKKEILTMQTIITEILELNQEDISEKLMEPVNIGEIVENCLLCNEVLIGQRELVVDNQSISAEIHTEVRYFYKIIDNLIKNAINYTPKGGRVEIQGERTSLTIINYGITIDKAILPQIFEPFVRTTSNVKGHGLGLYIVAHYSKLLGIEVNISNDDKNNCVIAVVSW